MSECITRVEKITKIEAHPNADRLEVAHVKGWHCVVPTSTYKEGDLCVYIPIDSVIPESLKETLFQNAKIDLPKNRIKTIRLRGLYSQGLVANTETIHQYLGNHGKHVTIEEGLDLTELLEIKKWEPKLPSFQQFASKTRVRYNNENFKKYKSIENYKNYNDLFAPEEQVIATEKVHGTNFRAGWVRRQIPETFFGVLGYKLKKFFNKNHEWEWSVGSHNVQLKPSTENNLYCDLARKYRLKEKLQKGEVVYGEGYGPNVQKGYHYGMKDGEAGLVVFDIRREEKYLDFDTMRDYAESIGLEVVPVLFRGKMKDLDIDKIVLGDSEFAPSQKQREGVVLKTVHEEFSGRIGSGRKVLKCISPDYLMNKTLTDYH